MVVASSGSVDGVDKWMGSNRLSEIFRPACVLLFICTYFPLILAQSVIRALSIGPTEIIRSYVVFSFDDFDPESI